MLLKITLYLPNLCVYWCIIIKAVILSVQFDSYCPFKDIMVWSILSFQGSYSYTNFHQKIFFDVQNFIQTFYQGQYGLIHIMFSRILFKCSPNSSIFFGVKKLLKNCIRHSMVWPLFSFSRIVSGFHERLMFFFLFHKSLRYLNHRQYGLTYIIHLENIYQFLSKAHIANSDQDKIQIEMDCPFNDSTYISIESSFLLLEIFLKKFLSGTRQFDP